MAVFAALGDVLGDPAATMRIVRRYVQPGGYVVVSDVCLREGGSRAFDGFEGYRSSDENVRGLTAHGDLLVSEAIEPESAAEEAGDNDVTAIRRRAEDVALRHPRHREQLLAFAEYQARAHAHIAEHLVDAVWVLQRAVEPQHTQAMD